jgi:hypothetical protein
MSNVRKYLPTLSLTLLLICAVIAVPATAYAQSCGCEVSDRKEPAYDEMLRSDFNEKAAVENLHLTFGSPWHLLFCEDFLVIPFTYS